MFITREYDYAMRAVRVLSSYEKMTVNEIATAEHIPQPYAYKILKKLEKASIVRAHRGAHGGYQLLENPQQITLYDIYLAIEEKMYINECLQKDYQCPNNTEGCHCGIHAELKNLQVQFIDSLRARKIGDMI